VDNGSEISHESFKTNQRHAFHGQALAIIQSRGKSGGIVLKATSSGLTSATLAITAR
jgi:beta-galactosidase